MRAVAVDEQARAIDSSLVEQWLPISQFSNAMNRSLGLHDSYPFVVRQSVVKKLNFIHRVVGAAVRGEVAMNFSVAASRPAPVGGGTEMQPVNGNACGLSI